MKTSMKTAFVTIRKSQWAISISDGQPDEMFPISGRGMKAFFEANRINDVMCSSSVDCPRDGGAKISGDKAQEILTKALSW